MGVSERYVETRGCLRWRGPTERDAWHRGGLKSGCGAERARNGGPPRRTELVAGGRIADIGYRVAPIAFGALVSEETLRPSQSRRRTDRLDDAG